MDQGLCRKLLLAVLAIAFVIRLAAILSLDEPENPVPTPGQSDAPTYFILADNILGGIGYRYGADEAPTAKRTPIYPLFIAAVFRAFGRDFNAVRGIQCALEVVTTLMVFALALRLFRSRLVAILASLGYAVYLPSVFATTHILTESLYTFLLVLFTLVCITALRRRSYALSLVAGAVLGLAVLTRPGVFLLPVALLSVALVARTGTWRAFILLALAFFVSILPWAGRNNRAMGKFIFTSTLMGSNLYKGAHLASDEGRFMSAGRIFPPELEIRLSEATEAQKDSILRAEAFEVIRSNKKAMILLAIKKIPRLWLAVGHRTPASNKRLVLAAVNLTLIGLGVLGFFRYPTHDRTLSLVPVTVIIFSSIMYLAVASVFRFALPLIPLLLPYSAAGCADLVIRNLRTQDG